MPRKARSAGVLSRSARLAVVLKSVLGTNIFLGHILRGCVACFRRCCQHHLGSSDLPGALHRVTEVCKTMEKLVALFKQTFLNKKRAKSQNDKTSNASRQAVTLSRAIVDVEKFLSLECLKSKRPQVDLETSTSLSRQRKDAPLANFATGPLGQLKQVLYQLRHFMAPPCQNAQCRDCTASTSPIQFARHSFPTCLICNLASKW